VPGEPASLLKNLKITSFRGAKARRKLQFSLDCEELQISRSARDDNKIGFFNKLEPQLACSQRRGDFIPWDARQGIIFGLVMEFLQTRRVFVAILALGLFTMAARSVTDPDVWWHLRTGQLIVQTHTVFHTDPYSFTRFGQPWVDHEWLSQVLIFGVYRLAGWGGLIAGFGAVTAAAFLVVFLRCPGRPYVAGVITLLGAFASAPSWGVRPQMLTLLLASVLLLILERSYQRPNLLWWTPLLMLLWVNLHAGYALGIALMALFLVGDALDVAFGFAAFDSKDGPPPTARFRALALAIVVCAAVVPLNPYGAAMYSYPLETLRSRAMQSYIGEWLSPDFHQHRYLPTLVMIVATVALPALSPQRLRPREVLLLLVTTYAALRSVRHIPIYALVAIPILSAMVLAWLQERGVAKRLESKHPAMTPAKTWVNAVLLAGFLVFLVARVRYVTHRQAETEAKELPAAAVSFIAAQRPPAPILNHYNWGGYFIWRLYPEYRVYIDGRADLYGDAFMDDLATTYYLRGDSWRSPFEKWGIRTVVLPPDAPLATALLALPDWQTIYADNQAVVLTKKAQ
jgi:hypothetical protein